MKKRQHDLQHLKYLLSHELFPEKLAYRYSSPWFSVFGGRPSCFHLALSAYPWDEGMALDGTSWF